MQQSFDYDWKKEVEEFEAKRAGVKGLIDSGIKEIPNFFIQRSDSAAKPVGEEENHPDCTIQQLQIPIIDLRNGGACDREKTVDDLRRAAETWGFFRIINHGIPKNVIDNILEATRRLHEQPTEFKTKLYSSDPRKNCRFFTINGDFKENQVANWRDSFDMNFMDDTIDPSILPSICRNEVVEYMNHMIKLKDLLSELLSEALGLNKDYLAKLECMKSEHFGCLYYPPCPEPELTLGVFKHSDTTFLTILCQDDCGGLQILHEGRWVDVPPSPMDLVVNIGDLMQLISNDKFKSVLHRVLARSNVTRVSTACFFFPSSSHLFKPYGPIKELVLEDNPPLYRQVSNMEYTSAYQNQVRERVQILPQFRLGVSRTKSYDAVVIVPESSSRACPNPSSIQALSLKNKEL